MFLSIFAATCRPNNVGPFLDNLTATCNDPSSFEVLFKLDEGANDLIEIIEKYKKTSALNIRYLATPKLDGYYTLEVGYNELLKIVHPDTYFCWLLTDEIRFETKGWDDILKKYIKFYPDDIFRVKLSIFQLKNYIDFFECLPCPDNYAVTTRKWLEITGGWGNFWGPDSWHQCVDYYLALAKNEFNPFGIWRSIPIFDIKVEGQEAGQGIEDPKKLRERVIKIWNGWQKHSTHAAQENFNKLAQRLNAHIYAHGKGIEKYLIRENSRKKTISISPTESQQTYNTWNYSVPKLRFKILVGYKNINIWHLFPKLYVHRWTFARPYHFMRKILIETQNMTYEVLKAVNLFLTSLLEIFTYICMPVLKLISKTIEFVLSLPANISRFIYKKMLKPNHALPSKISHAINTILMLPVTLYRNIVVKAVKAFISICMRGLHLLHPFKTLDMIDSKSRRFFKSTPPATKTYLYDGTHLKEITD